MKTPKREFNPNDVAAQLRSVVLKVCVIAGGLVLARDLWCLLITPGEWIPWVLDDRFPALAQAIRLPWGLHAIAVLRWPVEWLKGIWLFLAIPLGGIFVVAVLYWFWNYVVVPVFHFLAMCYTRIKRLFGTKVKRHIIICLDGTWNYPKNYERVIATSNVFRFWENLEGERRPGLELACGASRIKERRSPDGKTRQVALYYHGVGNPATYSKLGLIVGGAFGFGAENVKEEAYRDIIRLYTSGADQITIVGFSRGAAAARLLTDHIDQHGLPHLTISDTTVGRVILRQARDLVRAWQWLQKREVRVEFLGLWDTVASFGDGATALVDLAVANCVRHTVHLIALDEQRKSLRLSRVEPPAGQTGSAAGHGLVEEAWLPGGHWNIGGLFPDDGLGRISLGYMTERFVEHFEALKFPTYVEAQSFGSDEENLKSPVRTTPGPSEETAPRRIPFKATLHPTVLRKMKQPDLAYSPENVRERLERRSKHDDLLQSAPESIDEDFQTEIEEQLRHYRDQLKERPRDVALWKSMAELLRQLGREREYRQALNEIDRLEHDATFESNVGAEIRLTRLEIEKLDFFGTFDWRFSPRMNVLLGKNGYGKSHLYSLIVALLQSARERSEDFVDDDSDANARVSLYSQKAGTAHETRYTKIGFEENTLGRVPILAISELRFIDKSRNDFGKEDVDDREDLKNHGAWHFLNSQPLGPIIQNFIFRLCQQYLKKESLDLPIVELYYDVVRRLTSSEFRIVDIHQRPNSARFRIEVLTEGNDRPVLLQHASQGTLSIMAMVSLIFDFLSSVYPDAPLEEVAGKQAIVFIDELDAHMHPSWQRKILGILRDSFPTVQFFVAAHSPLVVAGCKRGEVAVLRRRREEPGFQLEQIERHFVGATTSELYSSIFEIEEKDETYLKYATMHPFKAEIEAEARQLEKKLALGEKEAKELAELTARQRALDHQLALATHLLDQTSRTAEEEKTLHKILEEAGVEPSRDDLAAALTSRLVLSGEQRSRLEELKGGRRLPPEEARRLQELRDDLYYLGEFERVEERRRARRMHEREVLLDLQERLTEGAAEQETTDG